MDARAEHGPGNPWLVSARWDLATFGGSALLAFALLAFGHATGLLGGDAPPWLFFAGVVFVDVAHVWSTAYRVYLDPAERGRRPGLYVGIPLAAWVIGVLLHTAGPGVFWRALAYLAVWHFVRQQYGWVMLYRRREQGLTDLDRWLDTAAIYAATLYPVLHWHAHLPRSFAWFLQGDFFPGLPKGVAETLWLPNLAIAAAFLLRQVWRAARGLRPSPGKLLIWATTWACWHGGIVFFDSDYAFTATNVFIHGIPYLAYVHHWGQRRFAAEPGLAVAALFRPGRFALYLAPLVLVAFVEEWSWDRLVWHDNPMLFPGPDLFPGVEALSLLVPLLALPQATHYALDAWIWRLRPENPALRDQLGL